MASAVFVVPGALETRTGGYVYDRRMIHGLGERGWRVAVRELDGPFPNPTTAALDQAARELASIPDGSTVLVDGLAFGAMPAQVCREAERLRLIALVHHPLAHETGMSETAVHDLVRSEREALAAATGVVVTSARTAVALADYGVPADRVAVVEPGTDRAPLARGSGSGEVHLLSVATLTPRKGHDVLFSALARLPHLSWRLTCLGSRDRDAVHVAGLRAQLERGGVAHRVDLAGEADDARLAVCYDSADLFVLPTRYEGYGMAVAEALARGLPVVSTPTGAIAQLVGAAAGVLVPPGDVDALTRAIGEVVANEALRARLAAGARRVRDQLPTWDEAAARMAEALERIGGRV